MIPQLSWFRMQPPSDLHGVGHTSRVMVWACVLTRTTPWFDPVLWAAACHDLRRECDGADLEHGFRAGRWVREKLPSLLVKLPDNLEWIASACDWHVCPDSESEWDHDVLWYLKDADGLDRVRLFDLEPSFLRHRQTREWIGQAQLLFDRTYAEQSPARIWQTALDLGLPVEELLAWAERQAANLKREVALR